MARVKDFMSSEVITITPETRLNEAAQLMKRHDVGILPIVDGNVLKGLVTDRDIVVKGLAEGSQGAQVSEIMSADVVSLSPDDDDKKAQQLMSDSDVRRLPVCDNGQVVGMVSVGDLAVRADEKRAGEVMKQTGPSR